MTALQLAQLAWFLACGAGHWDGLPTVDGLEQYCSCRVNAFNKTKRLSRLVHWCLKRLWSDWTQGRATRGQRHVVPCKVFLVTTVTPFTVLEAALPACISSYRTPVRRVHRHAAYYQYPFDANALAVYLQYIVPAVTNHSKCIEASARATPGSAWSCASSNPNIHFAG